jgi:hypothetical protein
MQPRVVNARSQFIGTDKIRFLGPPRRNEYSRYNFIGSKTTEMDSRPMRRRPYVERVRQPAGHCDENTGWQSAAVAFMLLDEGQSGSLSTMALIDRIAACTEAAASPALKAASATAAVFKCPITASFSVS